MILCCGGMTVFCVLFVVYYETVRRDLKIKPISECQCDERLKAVVYYESRKRELKTRPIHECRYDERLKTKSEKSISLGYTGLLGELEHLKIKTRLINEMFASVMCEYVFLK